MVVTLPISRAVDTPSPTRLMMFTGPLPPVPGVSVSVAPNVTPAVASSMISRPSSVSAAEFPMSSLKKTDPVPASIVRSFPSVACESIGASFVKVTFAPPVAVAAVSSVSIRRSVLSVTAPLSRTLSEVVSMFVSMFVPAATPSNVIPLAPIVVALPMLIESSVMIDATPSLLPKVTPTADVTVSEPGVRSSAPVPVDAPMSPSKTISPVAAVRIRLLCSSIWLSSVLLKLMLVALVLVTVTLPVSRTASSNVTAPLSVVTSASSSVEPAALVVRLSSGDAPPTSALNRVTPSPLTVRSDPVAVANSSTVEKNVTSFPAVTVRSAEMSTASWKVTSIPASTLSLSIVLSRASIWTEPAVASSSPRTRMSASAGEATRLVSEISRLAMIWSAVPSF